MYPGEYGRTTPNKPAVIMGSSGTVVTYAELDERSRRLSRLLHERGLVRGDMVAIFAENHPRYFEVAWAALRSGMYLVTVNRYLQAEEAAYLITDSGAKAFISTTQQSKVATEMLEFIPDCQIRLMMDGTVDGFESYEDAIASASDEVFAEQPRGDFMLYSSGTTGRPKGIKRALPDRTIDDGQGGTISLLLQFMLGMNSESIYLCPAPLYHSAAIIWSCGVHEIGGTVVVLEKFDAEEFLRIVERDSVTHAQVVPTMMVRMLGLPDEVKSKYDLSSLQLMVHAAAPCPPEAKRQMIEWLGPIVSEYYAGTEGTGMTFLTSEEWLAHPGSVGKPINGIPHICDEEGNEVETGGTGLVYFEQPQANFEYHGDPEKTKDSRHPQRENWMTLGDIGYLDEDGFLYLTDRRAFTIISGGVNIYPAEIESALIMHPDVVDIAVFGLPDPEFGEYVHAVVQLEPGIAADDATVEALRGYAREHLAGFKVPRVFDFRDELPRLPTGKLYKQQIRDEYLGR